MKYHIFEDKLILTNIFVGNHKAFKIENNFTISKFCLSLQKEKTLKERMDKFLMEVATPGAGYYNVGKNAIIPNALISSMMTNVVRSERYIQTEQRMEVLNLSVTNEMINNLIKACHRLIKGHSSDASVYLKYTNNSFKDIDSFTDGTLKNNLYRTEEKQLKIAMLQQLVDFLIALKEDKVKEIILGETGNAMEFLRHEYQSIVYGENKGLETKEKQYQYKMLDALKNNPQSTTGDTYSHALEMDKRMEKSANGRTWHHEVGCIKITKATFTKPTALQKEFKVDLNVLCPDYITHLKSLKNLWEQCKTQLRVGLKFEAGSKEIWVDFNHLKVSLMFSGLTEQQAFDKINAEVFQELQGYCELTKQIIPARFEIPVKLLNGTIIKANGIYIITQNQIKVKKNGEHTVPRYFLSKEKGFYEEQKISGEDMFLTTKMDHKADVLDYLTPLCLPNENVKPYTEDKGYRPTPYLGVELEVERKGTTKKPTVFIPEYFIPEYFINTAEIIVPVTHNPQAPAAIGHNGPPQEIKCDEKITEKVLDDLGRHFIIIKHDGSLQGHYPFEIVTTPATIEYHKKQWKQFMSHKEVKDQLQSYSSGACGTHVHISRDSFTGLHLARFMLFFNSEENHKFIIHVAQRTHNHYSKYHKTRKFMDHVHNIRTSKVDHNNHYAAINTSNATTIEVRIFRGNLAITGFFKNIEFVHAVWAYTLECGINNLKHTDFLEWLFSTKNTHHKLYNHLERWLYKNEYNVADVKITREITGAQKQRLLIKRKENKKIQAALKRKYSKTSTDRHKEEDDVETLATA